MHVHAYIHDCYERIHGMSSCRQIAILHACMSFNRCFKPEVLSCHAPFTIITSPLDVTVTFSLYRLHYKKTSRTVRVTKIAPDKSPLVVKPAVPMTHMSSGKHP